MVTFDTKKTFVNLLLIALLINFTPVICGIIVDVSNIVTDFFLSDVDFSDNLRVLNDNFGNKTNIEGLLSKGGAFWGEMAAGIAYSVISGLILLTFGGIFLLRHIMIWILVIFSPLAFFAWIFAKTRKWFDFWWKQFIMWSFIAVPAAFFLYLGTHLVYEIQNSKVIEYNMADPSGGLFSKLVPYLMVIIFLGVGLGATKKLTPIGASVVIGAVGKIKGKGLSLSKKYGKKLGAWSAKTTAGTTAGGMAGAIEGMKQAKEAGGGGGAMLKAAATGLGAGAATRTGREAGRHSFWKNVERIPIIGKPGMAEERRKKRLGMSDAGSRAKNLSSPAIEKQIENFNPLTGNVGNMRSWIQELVNRDDFEYSAEKGGKGEKYINTGKQHGVDFTKLNKSRQDLTIYTKSNKVNANMKTLIDTAGDDYSEDQRAEYRKKAELQLLEGELEKVSKRGGRNISTKTLEDKRIAKLIRDKHGRIYDDIYNQGDKKRKISLQKGFHKLLKDENNFEKDGTTIKPTKEKYVNETKDLLNRLNIELNMPGDNEEDEADDEEERESTLITENLEEEFRNAKKGQ